MTDTSLAPETLQVDQNTLGGHGAHWQLLTNQPDTDVPAWLQHALADAHMSYGLNRKGDTLPQDIWLINGAAQPLQISQLIKVNEQQQPVHLITAFPVINSPYIVHGKISRIICCKDAVQAVLNITTTDGTTLYAFDNLYAVNQHQYQKDQIYQIELGGFAYSLEKVKQGETIVVDDPAAIQHHRALNDILASNGGIAPENLQEQISQWQPKNEDDTAPVTLDLSKMVAYLYGEHIGQEDEAWFQGEILGLSTTQFMDKEIQLIDVCIMREEGLQPVVARLAYSNLQQQTAGFNGDGFKVGDYIRGNIWLQANIYATNSTE